jgi:hypothetical protein
VVFLGIFFHYKRKIKERLSTNPPISTKRRSTSHLKQLDTAKTTIFRVGNPGGAQKCGGVKSVNRTPNPSSLTIAFPITIHL